MSGIAESPTLWVAPIRPILRTASQSALDMPYEPVTNDDAVDIIA